MRSDLRKHRRTVAYFLSLLPLSVYITPAGAQTNFTIDDQAGDELTGVQPTYTPSGDWAQGATCTGCLAKPDPSKAFGGTWHDATHGPGDPNQRAIEISFSGASCEASHDAYRSCEHELITSTRHCCIRVLHLCEHR